MIITYPLRYLLALILSSALVIVLRGAFPLRISSPTTMHEEQKVASSRPRVKNNNIADAATHENSTDKIGIEQLEMKPSILYGIEIAFLFPVEVYTKSAHAENRKQKKKNEKVSREENLPKHLERRASRREMSPKSKAMNDLVKKLQEAGLHAIRSAHIIPANKNGEKAAANSARRAPADGKAWKIQWERFGFEVASPIAPSFHDIELMMTVVRDFGCFVHPELTSMHINIDARGRSLGEARNVYKNILAVEPALDHLRFTKKSTVLGGEANNMGEVFHNSLEEAYHSLDKSSSFQSLIHLGQSYESEEVDTETGTVVEEQQVKYKVGMKLKANGTLTSPKTFEFRGLETSFDPKVAISWLKLGIALIGTSYEGNVLEPLQRSDDETWSALFGNLVTDESLEQYFRYRRKVMKQERLRHLKSGDLLEIQAALCRMPNSIMHKDKMFRRTYCEQHPVSNA